MRIDDVHAIVVGGASGLGAATATLLAGSGARISVLDINRGAAEALAATLGGFGAGCDVTSEDSAAASVDACVARLGGPRILVNCAGIGPASRVVGRRGPHSLEMFARVVTVNLVGSFNMLRLVAARMAPLDLIGEERGVIVNTASVAAYDGQIGQAAYAASKAGIVGMTLPIARELSQFAIRVNTVAPGLFLTPLLMEVPEEGRASLASQVPFPPRLGNPAEFAALVQHIVTNAMLNGETIRLDGAIRMAPK